MKAARNMLVLSLVFMALHGSRTAFISFVGVDPSWVFGMLAVVTVIIATLMYISSLGPPPSTPGYSAQLNLLLLIIVVWSVYGYFYGALTNHVILDAGVMMVFWCFLYLGRYDRVWEDLEKPLYIITAIGFLFVLIGLTRAEVSLSYTEGIQTGDIQERTGRWTTGTLGYRLRVLLLLTPMLFALSYTRTTMDWKRVMGFLFIVGWFALAIHFWKRGPVLRVLGYVAFTILLSSRYSRKFRAGMAFVVGLGGVVVLLFLGSRIGGLVERYLATGNILQNERWYEARMLLRDFNLINYIIGRGMGGFYAVSPDWPIFTPVTRDGFLGRWSIHVGMLWPFLKGGLLLCVVYYGFFARMFTRKGPWWYMNRYNFTAIVVMPVYWLYLIIGTAPTMSGLFQAVMIGLCCARFAVPAHASPVHSFPHYFWQNQHPAPLRA